MSFIDNEAIVVAATPFDLAAKRMGPGNPIKCLAIGVPAALITVQHAPDAAGVPGVLGPLMTVSIGADEGAGNGTVEFELPSTTQQWIQSDVGFNIVVCGNQTNI